MKNLLLVEDDRALAKMYAKKLGSAGWDVKVCHDGTDATRIAKSEPFDVVVLDLMLPGLSGIDILEMLRSDKATSKIPIVVYTNYGDKYNRDKCITYGADEFVLKVDSTPESLSQTITSVYEKRLGK